MKKLVLFYALLSGVMLCGAALENWSGPKPVIDGKLTEAGWKKGTKITDLKPFESENRKAGGPPTVFMVRKDSKYLYIGADCSEPNMGNLRMDAPIWTGDGIEFLCCPTGKPDEYYQFRVNATGLFASMFYAESGNIRPDPFMPVWEQAVSCRKDGWSVEIRIPWHAFYMTSPRSWSSTWKVNFARERRKPLQRTCWSPQRDSFNETTKYRSISGFPQKTPDMDIYIKPPAAEVTGVIKGKYRSDLIVEIISAVAGDFAVAGNCFKRQQLSLKAGVNTFRINEVVFDKTGRNYVSVNLLKNGHLIAGRSSYAQVEYEPVRVKLAVPAYRDTFYPGDKADFVKGTVSAGIANPVKLEAALDNGKGRTFSFKGGTASFELPVAGMSDGDHVLNFKITVKDGKSVSKQMRLRKFSKAPENRKAAWVVNGQLVVNGKPWIPRFIYAHYWHAGKAMAEKTDKDDLAVTGVLQRYQKLIDPKRMPRYNKGENFTRDVKPGKTITEALRKRIMNLRDQDFLYYFLFDEPECTSTSPVYLKHIYEMVKELDPWHPVLIPTRSPEMYVDCADVLVPHPYIGPSFDGRGGRYLGKTMDRVRDYIKAVPNMGRIDKVVGLTGQFFSYKNLSAYADYPTFSELEAQVWTSVANGGRWFYNYAYHDLGDRPVIYEGTRYLFTSMRALESFFCTAEKLPLKSAGNGDKFDAVLWKNGGVSALLIVNLLPEKQKVSVSSAALKKVSVWHIFRQGKTLAGKQDKFTFDLAPYECLFMTSEKMDANLPLRSKSIETIAKQEKERLSRPNILLEKGKDVEFDTSVPMRSQLGIRNKLFDGTRDVWAWAHLDYKTQPYIVMSFPEFVPKFRKLRLYGTPLSQNITVELRKAGTWRKYLPKKVRQEKYMMEYDFGEQLKTVRIRLTFPKITRKQHLEIYEIELE